MKCDMIETNEVENTRQKENDQKYAYYMVSLKANEKLQAMNISLVMDHVIPLGQGYKLLTLQALASA